MLCVWGSLDLGFRVSWKLLFAFVAWVHGIRVWGFWGWVFRLLIKSRSIYFSLHTYAVWELSATLACDVNKRNTKPIIVYLTIQIQTHVCSVFDNFSQMFKSHLLLVLM